MLIPALTVAALFGAAYMAFAVGHRTPARVAIGAGTATLGAAAPPLALGRCTFAAESTSVDHVLTYALMAGGAWLALIVTRAVFDARDGTREAAGSSMGGEIRSGGFRLGWWVPWALLAPTLAILAVFLYTPAVQTFTLSTKLARLGAPRTVDVCLTNFSELLIQDPTRLVLYPLLAVGAVYGARFWMRRTEPGTWNHRFAEVASVAAMLSVFVALYAIFSPGGDGTVKYRPVYVNTVIISVGIVAFGMTAGLAVAYLAFQKVKGATMYRTLLIWPYAISPAVAGILFFMLLDPTAGIISNGLKEWFGIRMPNYRESALLAQAAIIMASGWKILGYNVLFYLAGLQTVSVDQVEAAVLDGASPWQRFVHIVMPALSPITFFLLVTNLTYAFFEVFATIDYMTKGAPAGATSVSIYEIVRVGVDNGDLGRGAAQSVLLFAAVIGVTLWQFRTSGKRVSYGGG